jgi:ferredoxin-fold anticodon binding domain-containing protein
VACCGLKINPNNPEIQILYTKNRNFNNYFLQTISKVSKSESYHIKTDKSTNPKIRFLNRICPKFSNFKILKIRNLAHQNRQKYKSKNPFLKPYPPEI